ncbi:hypothetical protein A5482_016000 (plasmid) [Cyanobacterium sp. IPPAS B-1200]|uniref:hypothetical protein n=1 Tax=Cyanobacterium sp. IPPAS B-1200 TaxID=1562720 RepID=UPI00085252EC|nr:hypothetical protein [Cyanobacterium sp. IPPAS B-1200]OEJ80001.1 hypothetical protein A5482_07650 [Cyanobacterium sp. IPPAS B-1200]
MLFYHLDYLDDHNLCPTQTLGEFHIIAKTTEQLAEVRSFFNMEELSKEGYYPDIFIPNPYEMLDIYDSQWGYVNHLVISTLEHRSVVTKILEFLEIEKIVLDDQERNQIGYIETDKNEIVIYLYEDIFNQYKTVNDVLKCLKSDLFSYEEKYTCLDSRYGIKTQTIIRPNSCKSKELIEMILEQNSWSKLPLKSCVTVSANNKSNVVNSLCDTSR